jgi:hypothetical protein
VAGAVGGDCEGAAQALRRLLAWRKRLPGPAESSPVVTAAPRPKPLFSLRRDPVVAPSSAAAQVQDDDSDRQWVAARVVRRIAPGSALARSLDLDASGSDILKVRGGRRAD